MPQVSTVSIEHVLGLPCIQNIHDYLQGERPIRWVLHIFARFILSIDPDASDENEFTVEGIVVWSNPNHHPGSVCPWFAEEILGYQNGEQKQCHVGTTGDKPNLVNCSNDDQRFNDICIGIDDWEYSIYLSLLFKR